jgi:hypothetical protein
MSYKYIDNVLINRLKMSFFQIVDVVMNSNSNRLGGPKNLGGSQYQSNTYRFPEDIGSYDKGHYILININEQKNTQFPGTRTSDVPTVIQNMRELQLRRGGLTGITNVAGTFQAGVQLTQFLAGAAASAARSDPDIVNLGNAVAGGLSTAKRALNNFVGLDVSGTFDAAFSDAGEMIKGVRGDEFLRTIRRTTDTIALYMPDTLKFSYDQTYKNLELGGKVGSLAGAGAFAASTYNTLKGGDTNNIATFAAQGAAELSNGPLFKALATSATGVVKNPMLEVIYSQPNLRQFSFSFMFYPRSEKEAEQVQKILDRLRFHQAPEIKNNSGGFFLIPPSEFDISFMYNGRPNPNIDKVSTCVLTNISVDYAPKGFHAYEVGGENDPKLGRTGMPVGIGVTLKFLETQIITKEYYDKRNFSRTEADEFALNQAGRFKDNTGSE